MLHEKNDVSEYVHKSIEILEDLEKQRVVHIKGDSMLKKNTDLYVIFSNGLLYHFGFFFCFFTY